MAVVVVKHILQTFWYLQGVNEMCDTCHYYVHDVHFN